MAADARRDAQDEARATPRRVHLSTARGVHAALRGALLNRTNRQAVSTSREWPRREQCLISAMSLPLLHSRGPQPSRLRSRPRPGGGIPRRSGVLWPPRIRLWQAGWSYGYGARLGLPRILRLGSRFVGWPFVGFGGYYPPPVYYAPPPVVYAPSPNAYVPGPICIGAGCPR